MGGEININITEITVIIIFLFSILYYALLELWELYDDRITTEDI